MEVCRKAQDFLPLSMKYHSVRLIEEQPRKGACVMVFLREITAALDDNHRSHFPYSVAQRKMPECLRLESPVTFFVGENGSGKSTILEAIAAALNLPAIGGSSVADDSSLAHARRLGKQLRLVWNQRTRRGFFARSEDFFNFARTMARMVQELAAEAEQYKEQLSGYGLKLATGSALGQRQAIIDKYGEDLDANSHGESMLHLLQERLVPQGMYLLDEPETPFSPVRQLALLSLIKQMAEQEDCQFVIATHSPILLALPGATIYSFDSSPVVPIQYEEIEHVRLTRDFLNNPQAFLRHL